MNNNYSITLTAFIHTHTYLREDQEILLGEEYTTLWPDKDIMFNERNNGADRGGFFEIAIELEASKVLDMLNVLLYGGSMKNFKAHVVKDITPKNKEKK